MVSLYEMGDTRLREILSKFQMPDGEYVVEKGNEFGESELWWVIKNQKTGQRFLLANIYSHSNLETEMWFYGENGFDLGKSVLRRPNTSKKLRARDMSKQGCLFGAYAIFELKKRSRNWVIIRDNAYEMNPTELQNVLSKFQMPDGKYVIEKNDEFGESELYWILKNQKNNKRYLLVNTYSHPNLEKEIAFYKKNGFNVERPILRDFTTLEKLDDKDDPEWNYLFGMYAVFELG